MVGASTAILRHSSSEFGEGHYHNIFVDAMIFQIGLEGLQRTGENSEEIFLRVAFVRVRVEAAQRDRIYLAVHAADDQLSDEFHRFTKRWIRVSGAVLVACHHL